MDAHDSALDGTAAAADHDQATVSKDGQVLAPHLTGVVSHSPVNHVDHRGRVFEVYPGDQSDFWAAPVVYCYAFSVRTNQIKGWGLHQHKDDRYTLLAGEVLTLLYDARTDSPTHGMAQKVTLSPEGVRQLLIPAGVWHLNINLAPHESMLINHPTRRYDHANPDRLILPWDSRAIPLDVAEYLPRQFGTPGGPHGGGGPVS